MNLAEINIDCLRAAESLLRDHDARITAAEEELKQLRRERKPKAERVQACIDVLCGRATPDLFTPAATPPVPELPPPPPAEAEVVEEPTAPPTPTPPASGLLRDIPGITPDDAHDMAAAGLRTLADLEARLAEGLSDYYRATRAINNQVYKVLVVPSGMFLGPDADRVATAVDKYLREAAEVPVPVVEQAAVPAEVVGDEVPPPAEKAVKAKGEKKAKERATNEPKPKSKKGKVKA